MLNDVLNVIFYQYGGSIALRGKEVWIQGFQIRGEIPRIGKQITQVTDLNGTAERVYLSKKQVLCQKSGRLVKTAILLVGLGAEESNQRPKVTVTCEGPLINGVPDTSAQILMEAASRG